MNQEGAAATDTFESRGQAPNTTSLKCFRHHPQEAARAPQSQTEWPLHLDSSENVQAGSLKGGSYIKITNPIMQHRASQQLLCSSTTKEWTRINCFCPCALSWTSIRSHHLFLAREKKKKENWINKHKS